MPRSTKRRAAAAAVAPETQAPKRLKASSARKQPEESKFNTKRLLDWFKSYTTDDPTQLGPDGMEKFCSDLQLEPENILLLSISWRMKAKNMGFFTQNEFINCFSELLIDTPGKLQKKLGYFSNLLNDPATFKLIFRFAFDFARDKDHGSRSLEIETAKALLALLLGKSWPLFSEFDEFLHSSKAKVLNKDQWNNIYEFSTMINTDLSNYSIDGAWPVLLDDFVEFVLQRKRLES